MLNAETLVKPNWCYIVSPWTAHQWPCSLESTHVHFHLIESPTLSYRPTWHDHLATYLKWYNFFDFFDKKRGMWEQNACGAESMKCTPYGPWFLHVDVVECLESCEFLQHFCTARYFLSFVRIFIANVSATFDIDSIKLVGPMSHLMKCWCFNNLVWFPHHERSEHINPSLSD